MDLNCSACETPIGKIRILSDGEAITAVSLCGESDSAGLCPSALTDRAAGQLLRYFAGTRRAFNLPINPAGTPFQKSVWRALLKIPYGETRSYKQIAQMIGNPLACRAVGMANNRNPVMILIPCHRVIGSDGSLVGYGAGLRVKEYLLALEKRR